MSRAVGVIGVPTSAAAFAPGQEQAPRALRDAGLLAALHSAGLAVHDHGDREAWRWRPDRQNPRAQNVPMVVEIVRDTATRVAASAAAGELTLVLGGDCTVGIGTVAGHLSERPEQERVGLLYFDTHADLNVPDSVPEGALDWMGMAHMLAIPGAIRQLVHACPRVPLLDPGDVLLFGWGPDQATRFERETIDRRRLAVFPVDQVAADPVAAATGALELMGRRCGRLLVHFDVDVIDFTDTPLSENWGRNEGLPFEVAMRALRTLLPSPLVAGLTITELNPDHAEEGSAAIERLIAVVAGGLAGDQVTR
jgi:arginase